MRNLEGLRARLTRRMLFTGPTHAAHTDNAMFHFQRVLAGIDPDQERLLFQEFVRLVPTAGPGVGIGLAMSARIVEAPGGAITVRSERGRGSVFVLWLPGE